MRAFVVQSDSENLVVVFKDTPRGEFIAKFFEDMAGMFFDAAIEMAAVELSANSLRDLDLVVANGCCVFELPQDPTGE